MGLNACNFENIKNVRKITAFFNQASIQKTNTKLSSEDEELKTASDIAAEDDVYLQTTQELEENVENLIFYDTEKNEETTKDLELNKEESEIQDDIIESTNATFKNESNKKGVNSPSASFFAKYFTNSTNKKLSVSPVLGSSNHEVEDNDRQDVVTESEDIDTELCSECREKIPKINIQSHQDYHFALKLSRSERVPQAKNDTLINKPTATSRKRKHNTKNTQNLKNFFTMEQEEPSGSTETCAECSKKIRIDEVESHKDYHAAKKLHREINSGGCGNKLPIRSQSAQKTTKKLGKKNQSSATNQSSKNMTSFFKPV